MKTPYYTLLERAAGSNRWQIAFGDYSRKVVEDEMRDMQATDRIERTGRTLRIITSDHTQAAIDLAVAALNHPSNNEVIRSAK